MPSQVDLCNRALARLKAGKITSLTDNTNISNLCNTLYDQIIEEVMFEGAFSTTIRRVDLNQTTTTPPYGFTYEFQLPTNPKCLRVLDIEEESTGTNDFVIEDDKLLANISTMGIRYVAKITDVNGYGPALTKVFVARLTAELAYPITGSAALADRMYAMYERELQDVLATDGQQGSGQNIISSDLKEVR